MNRYIGALIGILVPCSLVAAAYFDGMNPPAVLFVVLFWVSCGTALCGYIVGKESE